MLFIGFFFFFLGLLFLYCLFHQLKLFAILLYRILIKGRMEKDQNKILGAAGCALFRFRAPTQLLMREHLIYGHQPLEEVSDKESKVVGV